MQPSQGEHIEPKRVRGQRQPSPTDQHRRIKQGQLPSPITQKESTGTTEGERKGTVTPPPQSQTKPFSQARAAGLSSPPSDTQAFTQSQFVYPPQARTYAVEDEEGEQVWGYLVPLDDQSGDVMVLRRREACPVSENIVGPTSGTDKVPKHEYEKQEEHYEKEKAEKGVTSGGYLIGRHRECGRFCLPPLRHGQG
jgi:serine/threonine-protein kinase Chk2